MGAPGLLVALDGARELSLAEVGGKAARLNDLVAAGLRVPHGFCLTTAAYSAFVEENGLLAVLRAELGRKPLATMRWEEMWDAGLRLRSAFLACSLPPATRAALEYVIEALGTDTTLVVRSSTPGEDGSQASFAGLHESVVGVLGAEALFDAVRVVWASLWSDAALLYMAELGMDPAKSSMAVVIQRVVEADHSGVAFGIDPREPAAERQLVEAVPGPCSDLVDGAVDPDRWVLDRRSGAVLAWRHGDRGEPDGRAPEDALLEPADLSALHAILHTVERICGWPPDVEWTGRGDQLCLLQARPVTGAENGGDPRRWYLGLRPGLRRLRELRRVVGEVHIPALRDEGERFARAELVGCDDLALADAIEERARALGRWRGVYRDEFIPFAHGLRALGKYYNDLVRPGDPFEFVGLVRGEDLISLRRNRALAELAARLRVDASLAAALEDDWEATAAALRGEPVALRAGAGAFLRAFDQLRAEFFDLEFAGERLCERPDSLLRHLFELARVPQPPSAETSLAQAAAAPAALERRLFAAAGQTRAEEAAEVLAVGRLSWRLRDDDNILLGRVESQLLRALEEAYRRLVRTGRAPSGARVRESGVPALVAALRDPTRAGDLRLPDEPPAASVSGASSVRPRQLVGQPASPGLATGRARHVRSADDVGRFAGGEVLICDAIQPNMTHLVPLACGVVERRGGMLIHSAIIARELGIPCVNGVSRAIESVPNGEAVTVDGDLGIVTIGPPEFRAEGVDPA